MEFRKITISQLEAFIHSGEYLKYNTIPITPQRALSQAKNPHALPDDVALTLAISDSGELEGFIGALPDRINDTRCAWNSCWWVKDGTPAEVSLKLFFSFLNDWNKKVLFSELTPHTSVLIEKMKFCQHTTTKGFRGYYRFCLADVLPRRKAGLKKIKTLLRIADSAANLFLRPFLTGNTNPTKLTAEENPELKDTYINFIERFNRQQPTKRYVEEFQWIKEFPWIVRPEESEPGIAQRYPFSYATNLFLLKWIRFSAGEKLVALVCYSVRDKELKLQYVFAEEKYIQDIGNYFYSLLLNNKRLYFITTFHHGLATYLSSSKRFLFKTNLPKFTAISNALIKEANIDQFEMQMGDGDCIFT